MKTGICIIAAMLCAEVGQASNKYNEANGYVQSQQFYNDSKPIWWLKVINDLADVFCKKSRYGGREYNTIDLSYDKLISYTIENWSFLPDSVKEKMRLLALEKEQFKGVAIPKNVDDTESIFVFNGDKTDINRFNFVKLFLEKLLDNPLGEARIKSILLVSYLQEAIAEKTLLRNRMFLEYNKAFSKKNEKIKVKLDPDTFRVVTDAVLQDSGDLTLSITGCFGPRLPQVIVYREGQNKREKEERCKDNVKYSYILRIIRDYGCSDSNGINSYLENSKVTDELSSKLININMSKKIAKGNLTEKEKEFNKEVERHNLELKEFVQTVTKEIVSERIKDEDIKEAFDKLVVTYIHELSHYYHEVVGFCPQFFYEPQRIEYDKEVLQYCIPCLNEAVKREIENNRLGYDDILLHQKGLRAADGSLLHSGFWGCDDEPLTELGFTFRYDRNEQRVYIIEDRINENMARLQCNMPYEVAHGSLGTPQPVEDALNVDGDGSYKSLLNEFYRDRNVDQNYVQFCNKRLQGMFSLKRSFSTSDLPTVTR